MKKICSIILITVILCGLLIGCTPSNGDKLPVATPENLSINGTLLTWDAVEDAVGYTVKVGDQVVDCHNSRFELAQLSLADGTYSVMVKAKGGSGHLDSDYSIAVTYVKGNVTEGGNGSSSSIDSSLKTSFSRYVVVSAPIFNSAPPLIASTTDGTYNYYLVDAGYIENTPIYSGDVIHYTGEGITTIGLAKGKIATSIYEQSLSSTVSSSVTESKSGSAGVHVTYESPRIPHFGTLGGEVEYSRQWGTAYEKSNSFSSTYTVANEYTTSLERSITYTIGEKDDKVGYYRLSIFTTCDVYYLVTANRDNSELIDMEIMLCARPGIIISLEHSEDGTFGKTSDSEKLDWADDFYKAYEIPEEKITVNIKLDVDGGKSLGDGATVKATFGEKEPLPVPRKNDNAFVGWFSEKNGEGERYTDANGNLISAWEEYTDKTLYAHWVSTVYNKSIPRNSATVVTIKEHHESYYTESISFDGLTATELQKLKDAGYRTITLYVEMDAGEIYDSWANIMFYKGWKSENLITLEGKVNLGNKCNHFDADPLYNGNVLVGDWSPGPMQIHYFELTFNVDELLDEHGRFKMGFGASGDDEDEWVLGSMAMALYFKK